MSRKRLAPPQRAVRTFSGNRQARKDFLDGAVEDRVGDREEAHEKEIGALGRNPGRLGHGFTEEAAGNGGTNELGRLIAGHGDDGEDGDPASKLGLAEQVNCFANAMNLTAKAEQRRIHVATEFIHQGKIAFEEFFHVFAGEARSGNGREEVEIIEYVSGDFARAEYRWFAEEITLEIGIAQRAGFVELGLCFDFFGEEPKAIALGAADDVGAQVAVGGTEINFQEFHEREKHLPFGVADVVGER
jgi:hypothetical protein